MELGGLHHLTAVTTDAKQNVDFYTRVLGMRLVKKTVNQDDVSAYHLFYADALGSPGTDVTFFDWPHLKVAPNRAGAGEVSVTGLRVPDREALQWWAGRLGTPASRTAGYRAATAGSTWTSRTRRASGSGSPRTGARAPRAASRGTGARCRPSSASGASRPWT
jgi:catechol 2,3-dioxygenase-like lactoylglutathione lyase family enzyme